MDEFSGFHECQTEDERDDIIDGIIHQYVRYQTEQKKVMSDIDEVIRNYSDDPELFMNLAAVLKGFCLEQQSHSSPFTEKLIELYQEGLKLDPGQKDECYFHMAEIYSMTGRFDKAEECWSRLTESVYDKAWAHAEILFTAGRYDEAAAEAKACILENLVAVISRLIDLEECLTRCENKEDEIQAVIEKRQKLTALFEMFDTVEFTKKLEEVNDSDDQTNQIIERLGLEEKPQLTKCALFKDIPYKSNAERQNHISTGLSTARILWSQKHREES